MRTRGGRLPAKEWFDELSPSLQGRALAAFSIVESSWRSQRPPGDRVGKIEASRCELWELRVTPKGGSPPHLRCTYLRRGQTMWLVTGFTKQKNKLSAREIGMADRVAADWLDSDTERRR